MNVKEIVAKWLKKNKYDGLCDEYGCGCLIDDLMNCEECPHGTCVPGYKIKNPAAYRYKFLITPEKEEQHGQEDKPNSADDSQAEKAGS